MNRELQTIRVVYGLSCRSMSAVLGLGENQWRLMEREGAPIGRTMYLLLLVVKDPRGFKKLIAGFDQPLRQKIGDAKVNRLHERIDKILSGFKEDEQERYAEFCKKIFS